MNYVLAWPVWWNPLHWLQHASATWPSVRDYNLLRLSQRELAGLQRGASFMSQGRGYQAIQGTRPQTLGYGLQDSPAGGLRLFCSVRGVENQGREINQGCVRPDAGPWLAESPVWLSGEGGSHWCCRTGQLPQVMLSHPLGGAIKKLGLACRGV